MRPGEAPQARPDGYRAKDAARVEQVLTLESGYQQHVVFVPFDESEGNMFGAGDWSYNEVSRLSDPQWFLMAWDFSEDNVDISWAEWCSCFSLEPW